MSTRALKTVALTGWAVALLFLVLVGGSVTGSWALPSLDRGSAADGFAPELARLRELTEALAAARETPPQHKGVFLALTTLALDSLEMRLKAGNLAADERQRIEKELLIANDALELLLAEQSRHDAQRKATVGLTERLKAQLADYANEAEPPSNAERKERFKALFHNQKRRAAE